MESVHYSISKLIISKLLCRFTLKIKFPYATKCNDNPLDDCLYVCNFSEINPFRRSVLSNLNLYCVTRPKILRHVGHSVQTFEMTNHKQG